jgi:adenosylcobinamide-GDP ribazoletransferase
MRSFLVALSFLTSIPVRTPSEPVDLGRAGAWFPAVGLLLGGILTIAHFLLTQLFSPLLAAGLVVALWAALTGGLHLDGLADCCDGLLAAVPPERRLEIMRDPRLGSFGVIGLTLVLVLKTLTVTYLPRYDPGQTAYVLFFAPTLARWIILMIARQTSARSSGMSVEFAAGLSSIGFIFASLAPLALLAIGIWADVFNDLGYPMGGFRAGVATIVSLFVTFAVIRMTRTRLGGITGDVLGLTIELTELTVLFCFAVGQRGDYPAI